MEYWISQLGGAHIMGCEYHHLSYHHGTIVTDKNINHYTVPCLAHINFTTCIV